MRAVISLFFIRTLSVIRGEIVSRMGLGLDVAVNIENEGGIAENQN